MSRPSKRRWVTVDARREQVQVQRFELRVIEGPDEGASARVGAGRVRVGARPDNELVLKDPEVSGLHAEVQVDEDGVRLLDRGSTNGTWIHGLRVQDVFLQPGLQMQIGRSVLQVEALSEVEEVELYPGEVFGPMVGRAKRMRALFARLDKIAKTDLPVLVTGETGTGKEEVARAIHAASPRAHEPFVTVDCSALPENLIESELFGHERGAFTGAEKSFPGAFERAGKGTLFLDELGELPLPMQPKLLRVLDRLEVRRVGGDRLLPVRARFVAATNRDLASMVNAGTFREDLYYRLAVAEVSLPPLRQRREDIVPLVRHFAERLAGGAPQEFDPKVLQALVNHSWPGNVRELRNAVQRLVLLDENPIPNRVSRAEPEHDPLLSPRLDMPYKEARDQLLERFQKLYAEEMLRRSGGSVAGAARIAGVDRMTLYRWMKKG